MADLYIKMTKDYKKRDIPSIRKTIKNWIWKKYLNLFPKKYRIIVAYGTVVFIILVTSIPTLWFSFQKGKDFFCSYFPGNSQCLNNSILMNVSASDPSKSVEASFNDFSKLINLENFRVFSYDPLTVSLKDHVSGNILFYDQLSSSRFSTVYQVLPIEGTKLNLVLQYDSLFRIIIGEQDFKTLSVEHNTNYPDVPAKWEKIPDTEKGKMQRFVAGKGFLKGTGLIVTITSWPSGQNLNLNLQISCYPDDYPKFLVPQNYLYTYNISLPVNSQDISGKFGIGLISNSDAKIQIQKLEVKNY